MSLLLGTLFALRFVFAYHPCQHICWLGHSYRREHINRLTTIFISIIHYKIKDMSIGKKSKVAKDESHPQATLQLPWHTMTIAETLTSLNLRDDITKVGLTTDEAAVRLKTYGPNKLTEKRKKTNNNNNLGN